MQTRFNEIDDAKNLIQRHGHSLEYFQFSCRDISADIASNETEGVIPTYFDHAEITVRNLATGALKIYSTSDSQNWLADLDADLRSGIL